MSRMGPVGDAAPFKTIACHEQHDTLWAGAVVGPLANPVSDPVADPVAEHVADPAPDPLMDPV